MWLDIFFILGCYKFAPKNIKPNLIIHIILYIVFIIAINISIYIIDII